MYTSLRLKSLILMNTFWKLGCDCVFEFMVAVVLLCFTAIMFLMFSFRLICVLDVLFPCMMITCLFILSSICYTFRNKMDINLQDIRIGVIYCL